MRFVRAIAGTVLLTIGLPALLLGGPLGLAAVRAELPLDRFDPPPWALLAVGAVLVALGIAALAWPGRMRPREVVFVVEPSQVPLLAARIGVQPLGGPAEADRRALPSSCPGEAGGSGEPGASGEDGGWGGSASGEGRVIALPVRSPSGRTRSAPAARRSPGHPQRRVERRVALRAADTEGHSHRGIGVPRDA
ncbi:hypothetical protein AB0J86_17895 [Micromonospora sp. NPDC049559]|uniref:hypothetical protein n=1 Tax=Micromonospora sp. NPDC049559 TaxID=3155923 RepID=UPI003416A1F8